MNKLFRTLITLFVVVFALTGTVYAQEATAPNVSILAPRETQELVTESVPVLLEVENFSLVDPATNTAKTRGQGHIHLWLDDQNPTPQSAVKTYEEQYIFENIAPGQHTLVAELVNNDHSPLVPPVTATSTFTTTPIPSSVETESGFDKQTALVIFVVVALVIVAAWWYTKEEDEEQLEKEEKPKAKKTTKKKATKAKKK